MQESIFSLKNEIEQLDKKLSELNTKLIDDKNIQTEFDKIQKNKQQKEQELLSILFKK